MFSMKQGGNNQSSALVNLQLESGQFIGRVVHALGNNVYQVETREPDRKEDKYLLPKRLRNYIYIRRGSIVIVEPYESPQGRVRGEVVETFLPDQVKTLHKLREWPQEWNSVE
ncbi:RNA-binding protein isoform 1 [Galdieria sulphuraria]|uniref:RNA-binding protein isoform 1 n=1 Tax=Galdieria sulphuraria TaxID=130081 RepID=M2X6R9_GALSU|nr:RNA-binding protein isoform 1 [Galdieria sulphuraria]EME32210.1 RNA-binding protein isoform 1 [Galdieria sulphuraria]|eukprot:XP_005708730.1 RNA-binding protein isoform 1 [Galdieria sulphuraria]